MAAGANLGSMWSTSSVPLKARFRVFGALLALEVVTGLGTILPMPRTDVPPAWDERTILTALLDYVRVTVHAKCEHLAEVDARHTPLSTSR